MLDVVLLVVCICIIIALILYLFYWNRLLGYIFGLVFRLYFWGQNESSVWLDIGEYNSKSCREIRVLITTQGPFISQFSVAGSWSRTYDIIQVIRQFEW